jgi:hypothetical protein
VPLNLINPGIEHSQTSTPKKNDVFSSSSTYPRSSTPVGMRDRAFSSSVKSPLNFCIKHEEGASASKKTSLFQIDQRVVCQDMHGFEHHGLVRWTGSRCGNKTFTHPVVGIQTVSAMEVVGVFFYMTTNTCTRVLVVWFTFVKCAYTSWLVASI